MRQTNTEYILMSGSAKLVAIGLTYPYQVIRSRIQVRVFLLLLRLLRSTSIPPCNTADAPCFVRSPFPDTPLSLSLSLFYFTARHSPSLASPPRSTAADQYQPLHSPPYTSIPNCISRTYAAEGLGGFYKGLATNAVRILPGTCVTFVVYEQCSRWLSRKALEGRGGGG